MDSTIRVSEGLLQELRNHTYQKHGRIYARLREEVEEAIKKYLEGDEKMKEVTGIYKYGVTGDKRAEEIRKELASIASKLEIGKKYGTMEITRKLDLEKKAKELQRELNDLVFGSDREEQDTKDKDIDDRVKKSIATIEKEYKDLSNRHKSIEDRIKQIDKKLKGPVAPGPDEEDKLNEELRNLREERNELSKQLEQKINDKFDTIGQAETEKQEREQEREQEKQTPRGYNLFVKAVCGYCFFKNECPAYNDPLNNFERLQLCINSELLLSNGVLPPGFKIQDGESEESGEE